MVFSLKGQQLLVFHLVLTTSKTSTTKGGTINTANLIVNTFHGLKTANLKRNITPKSCPIITSNFDLSQEPRYVCQPVYINVNNNFFVRVKKQSTGNTF